MGRGILGACHFPDRLSLSSCGTTETITIQLFLGLVKSRELFQILSGQDKARELLSGHE